MKRRLFYISLSLVALLALGGCKDDKEADLTWLTSPEEKMELTVSATATWQPRPELLELWPKVL